MVAILNSKLVYYHLSSHGSIIRGGYLEFRGALMEMLPIPKINKKAQQPFIELSEKIHALAVDKESRSSLFKKLLTADFKAIDTSKYGEWYRLYFSDFTEKLKRDKIIIKNKDKEEWLERFDRIQSEIKLIDTAIDQAEQELNERTYQLYDLTAEEINLIEGG